jgi:hypothetical protein
MKKSVSITNVFLVLSAFIYLITSSGCLRYVIIKTEGPPSAPLFKFAKSKVKDFTVDTDSKAKGNIVVWEIRAKDNQGTELEEIRFGVVPDGYEEITKREIKPGAHYSASFSYPGGRAGCSFFVDEKDGELFYRTINLENESAMNYIGDYK